MEKNITKGIQSAIYITLLTYLNFKMDKSTKIYEKREGTLSTVISRSCDGKSIIFYLTSDKVWR